MSKTKEITVKLLASFFYAGFFPIASGTIGTLVGVLFYSIIYLSGIKIYLLVTSLFFISGVEICSQGEIVFGQRDSSKIIIDEIAGYLIAMFLIPFKLKFIILGFLIFRIFDIWKPFPIFTLQRLPRGWGVMADDFMAGVYSNLILQLLVHFSM